LSHETQIKQQSAALKFCRGLGFFFEGSLKISAEMIHVYKIRVFEENEFYPILSINDYSPKRNKFSILISEKYSSFNYTQELSATLYVWSNDLNSILNVLNLSESSKEKIKENSQKLKENGYQIMYYCKKEMTSSQKNDFLHKKKLKQTAINFNNEELDDLYNEIEFDLDFILGVYFEYDLKLFAIESIQDLIEAKMKLFLLSEDNEEKIMATAYKTKIITHESNIKKMSANDEESLAITIKYILNNIKKDIIHYNDQINTNEKKSKMFSSKDFFKMSDKLVLIFDGKTLEMILNSKYSTNHFKFLILISSHFIAYNMTPILKKEIIRMMKSIIQMKYAMSFLAIGNNHGDSMMLKEADISFEIHDDRRFESIKADIYLESFRKFSEIVLVSGRLSSEMIENIIYWLLFAGNILTYVKFIYEFFSFYSHTELIPIIFMTLIMKNCLILSIACFCLLKDKKNPLFLMAFPVLYVKKTALKRFEIKNFVLKIMLPSAISCSILFIFTIFDSFTNQSQIKTVEEVQIQIFIEISLLIYIQVKNFILL